MKIKIRDILSSGTDFSDQAMPGDIDIKDDFIDFNSPVIVRGRLSRADTFIIASLGIAYTVDTVCARCLVNIHHEVSLQADLEFEFDQGDEYLDVGQGVREEILLHYPVRALCSDECKGICAGCGAYLNEEECECDKSSNS